MLYNEIIKESALDAEELSLFEGVTDKLKGMVDSGLTKPFSNGVKQVKNDVLKKFVPILRAWAENAYQDNNAMLSKEELALVNKVLYNPEQVAQELLRNIENPSKVKSNKGRVTLHYPTFQKTLQMFMKD